MLIAVREAPNNPYQRQDNPGPMPAALHGAEEEAMSQRAGAERYSPECRHDRYQHSAWYRACRSLGP